MSSFDSFRQRWSTLTQFQQLAIIAVGLLLLYGLATSNLLSPGRLIAATIIVFVAFPVHEFAHAAMAVALGDDTPKYMGRYTLNPIAHIDPLGAILIFITFFGWAKPVQWNPRNIDIDPRLGVILVSLAGPVSNLLMAAIAIILLPFVSETGGLLPDVFGVFIFINVLLFVFNMIPIPPLDGSHILFALLPQQTAQLRIVLSQFGFMILIAIIFLMPGVIRVPTQLILRFLLTVFG
ncbi:site-2 protease family protein [Chloroflexi bacterium TSY]|nr:site-2 protease family protein [Chloroflexi bacterium TSY]